MNASGLVEYGDIVTSKVEAERQECDWLLTSGALGRSGNLTRVLRYVCDEYFEGRADLIKEYTIAVEALGRRPDFNPQTDTIVRVTVHALRKRLLDVYQHEGADRPVQLILPPGHYAPSFIHESRVASRHLGESEVTALPEEILQIAEPAERCIPAEPSGSSVSEGGFRRATPLLIPYLIAVALIISAAAVWWWNHNSRKAHPVEAAIVANGSPPPPQTNIHALMGKGRAPYVDHSGVSWTNGNYCRSGSSVNLPNQRIEGTEDAPLYLGGVRGIVHCAFPVPPGLFEVHLYFADTFVPNAYDPPMSTRDASIILNSGATRDLKVVDEAGGHNTALTILTTGVSRENDGSIHLDYVSEVSPLNAVEILPAPSPKQLPIRVLASTRGFVDDAGQAWESDRYFNGGRHGQQLKLANLSDLGIYQSSRIGRFRYNFPAIPYAYYRVKLYFRDPWFGKDNGGAGGPGSRVFDVACNGNLLLKNFDILAEGDSRPVVKTFDHVQASAAGRIELYFMPVVNYPAVSAVEIVPED